MAYAVTRERPGRNLPAGPLPCRPLPGRAAPAGLCSAAVPWFFTVVLIAISAATLAFTGYLLRSVLVAEPVHPPAADADPAGTGS